MIRDASLSACGRFRFYLTRIWDPGLPALGFIMLNPSTADGIEDDPTIRKCIGFAERLGFGGITVANLYAFRATDPKDLKAAAYPRHDDEDNWIGELIAEHTTIVCAWGRNAKGLARPAEVLRQLRKHGVRPQALRLSDDGTPWHPLMLPYSCTLIEMGGGHA